MISSSSRRFRPALCPSLLLRGESRARVTTLDEATGETAHRYPQFLPDGKHFLYGSLTGSDDAETRIASLDGGDSRALVTASGTAVYANPGYLLYEAQNSLIARKFDPGSREITGDPIALPDVPLGTRNYYKSPPFAVSASGAIAYLQTEMRTQLAWYDRQGNPERCGTPAAGCVHGFQNLTGWQEDYRRAARSRERLRCMEWSNWPAIHSHE